jgi:hypothetical protein
MSSEDEFFDKLEPFKEKPSPVIQKELIVSPENPTTVHKKLVKILANEIDLTKTENLAGKKLKKKVVLGIVTRRSDPLRLS